MKKRVPFYPKMRIIAFSFILTMNSYCMTQYVLNYYDNEVPPLLDDELVMRLANNRLERSATKKLGQAPAKTTALKSAQTGAEESALITAAPQALSMSYFQALDGYDSHAKAVPINGYQWIGKVIHTRSSAEPYVCTAACIRVRIFITTARCLANLKVNTSSVLHDSHTFPVKAFILPSQSTKQWFDDIGLVVVFAGKYSSKWDVVGLFDGKRTDNGFKWFANLKIPNNVAEHKVIGFSIDKYLLNLRKPNTAFKLKELDVIVDINLCADILGKSQDITGYYVPCFHSCTLEEFKKRDAKCQKYLGTEGGALLNMKTNKLLGISSWGTKTDLYELPVGFAVPNSDTFHTDFACAVKVLNERNLWSKGLFHKVCQKSLLVF